MSFFIGIHLYNKQLCRDLMFLCVIGGSSQKDDLHRRGNSPRGEGKDRQELRGPSPVSSTKGQRSVRTDFQDIDKKNFLEECTQSGNSFHSTNCAQDPTVGSVLQEKTHSLKNDYKNSRRKADRPKRRRRDYDMDCLSSEDYSSSSLISKQPPMDQGNPCCEVSSVCHPLLRAVDSSDRSNCGVPEDLSLHNYNMRQASVGSTSGGACESRSNISVHCWQNGIKERKKEVRENPSSSVKDLEDVMNKHLPNMTNHVDAGVVRTSPSDHMSSQHMSGSLQKPRCTIQWRGNPEADSLPASTLLRTLYANRESVIRSSARPQCFNGDTAQGVDTVDLLTPPSNEGGLKEQLTLNIPQIALSNSKCGGYTNPLSVSVHSSIPDSFTMTPPSSVSPEEKVTTSFMETNFDPSPVSCHMATGPTITNPVKSMALSAPALSDYNNTCSKLGYSNPYQVTEYPQYLHNGTTNPVYDTRPDGWYPVSYTS